MTLFQWIDQNILNGGIKASDSDAKARAIRISNVISLSAIANTAVFGMIFLFLDDMKLFYTCLVVSAVYSSELSISLMGYTQIGRLSLLTTGNLIVFYFACIFRGESDIQLLFYSLSVVIFMHFSWEERKNYALVALPVSLLLIGEFFHWNFFEAPLYTYDLRYVRLFAVVAPLHQIISGFFYFLKQSVKFEAESNENLRKLELEHKKQIQVQKLSSLGEMAGGISHEINNPLMVIIGKTYNLKRDLSKKLPPEDSSFADIEKIDSMVYRISRIIRALRNFSRNSEHDPSEKVDLQSILDSTLDLCRERFASNGINLEIKSESQLEIFCRPTEIAQVLLNLLNNAFDASESRPEPKVSISARKVMNKIEIIVEDNGKGIPSEIEDKIMQPFFTTKDIGKGTGLGLSISKGLIESHQGTLTLTAGTGKTTFQILLPAIP